MPFMHVNGPIPNAHGAQALHEDGSVRGAPIPDEVWRRMVPRKRLGNLARYPLRGRIGCHTKRHPVPSSVTKDDEAIKSLERDRWQDKQVDRRNAIRMIVQKGLPALRRWQPAAAYIPSNRRLGDLEAELEKLTMNRSEERRVGKE